MGLMRSKASMAFFFNVYSIGKAAGAEVSGLGMIQSGFHQSTTVFKVCLHLMFALFSSALCNEPRESKVTAIR